MIVSISQPTLFPWIGYFNIIKKSDAFVFLDTVKFEKHSWQMRNKLKEISKVQEHPVWIRIPTRVEKTDTLIKDVIIDNMQSWKEAHLKSFQANYGDSYREIEFIDNLYDKQWNNLSEFNIEFISKCCEYLDIHTRLLKSSKLKCVGKKGDLVLNICKELDATDYLSTVGSADYLEDYRYRFDESGIKIIYHDYTHPIYRQRGKTFIENLSILDLIFNEKNNAKNFV